jgi:hypothetical protein
VDARGKRQAVLAEVLDGAVGRARAGEDLEEHTNAVLHLRVRVEHHPPGGPVDEADRKPQLKRAALGLVQDAAAQLRP